MIIYAPSHSPNNPTYLFYGETEKLTFVPEEWRYYRHMPNGTLVPQDGVTNITKLITPAKPLMVWAVKQALAKTKLLLKEGGYLTDSDDTGAFLPLYEAVLDDILTLAKKADEEALTEAGDIGTEAHDWIERLIKTILSGNEEKRHEHLAHLPTDPRAGNAAIAACGWMYAHNVRWICTERKCFSKKHGYCGTMDGLAYVDSCDDPRCCPTPFKNRRSVIDWKTSNALRVGYMWQAAAYRAAYVEEMGETIEDTWILRLDKETAEFDPWHFEGEELFQEDFKGFLLALETHRAVERAEDRVSGIKAGRTAEKRADAKEEKMGEQKIKCKNADKYKGVRLPTCNGGDPCLACVQKWQGKHPPLFLRPKESLTTVSEPCTITTVEAS